MAFLQRGVSLRMDGGSSDREQVFFPAHTYPADVVGDHHPVSLELLYSSEMPPKAERVLGMKALSDEHWASVLHL